MAHDVIHAVNSTDHTLVEHRVIIGAGDPFTPVALEMAANTVLVRAGAGIVALQLGADQCVGMLGADIVAVGVYAGGDPGDVGLVPKGSSNLASNYLDGTGNWSVPAAGGTNVTAAAVLTDNTIIIGAGGARGVEDSVVTLDPASGNMGSVGTLGCGAITSSGALSCTTITTGNNIITIGTGTIAITKDEVGDPAANHFGVVLTGGKTYLSYGALKVEVT